MLKRNTHTRLYGALIARHIESGVSVFELLVSMALVLCVLGLGVMRFKDLDASALTAASALSAFLKQVRAEAISGTVAYALAPSSSGRLESSYSNKCSDVIKTKDLSVRFDLPKGATFHTTAWTLCFNSRGMPDANVDIVLRDIRGNIQTVEVMLGGAVRLK